MRFLFGKLFRQVFIFAFLGILVISPVFAQSGIKMQVEDINTGTFPQMEVYVSVTSPQGLPVENLTMENFSILEDGNSVDDFTVSLTQNTQQGISFVLAIDTSGSMRWDGTPSRLDNAVGAATAFVEGLSVQDQVGLVTFGEEVRIVQGVTTDHKLVTDALKELKARKNTYLYDGLVAALNELENVQSRRVVILITDGADSNVGNHSYAEVINQAVKNTTPIYILGFGDVDEKELNEMATLTGGDVQINPNSEDLLSGFEKIIKILREQYLLSFQSKLPVNNQEHKIAVSVDYLDETYSSEKSFFIDTAPRIAIKFKSPDAGDSLSGSQEILVSIDSKYKIEEVIISANDEVLVNLTEEPYFFNWELYSVHNGDYTLKVEARDEKGLTQTEELVVAVNQIGGGGGESGSEKGGNMSLYLIFSLFAVALVILIAFGIRKRRQQADSLLPPEENSIPVLVELQGRNVNKIWQLNTPEIRLGRKADINDIPLQGSKASREMAVIQTHQDQHIIYSVKSNNPILVNDIPIQRETILRTGDIIALGESLFRYEIQS